MLIRTHIMVHHSLTEDSGTVSWSAIEQYHRETNGWNDTGYHTGIEQMGDGPYKYQALLGRPEGDVAAACPEGGMNHVALHVCCVGNYDLIAPPEEMLQRLVDRIIKPWMIRYGIKKENVIGHRDYNPHKTCPGTMFDLDKLRGML